jgi:hypothetical protein
MSNDALDEFHQVGSLVIVYAKIVVNYQDS